MFWEHPCSEMPASLTWTHQSPCIVCEQRASLVSVSWHPGDLPSLTCRSCPSSEISQVLTAELPHSFSTRVSPSTPHFFSFYSHEKRLGQVLLWSVSRCRVRSTQQRGVQGHKWLNWDQRTKVSSQGHDLLNLYLARAHGFDNSTFISLLLVLVSKLLGAGILHIECSTFHSIIFQDLE